MSAAYRVYVLRNGEGRFYVGVSDDVTRRLQQHNSGESRWTKHRGPWIAVWQSEELSLGAARKLENQLKRQGRVQVFTRSLVYVRVAHNPAAAGSLVQIQPPQPISLLQRLRIHAVFAFADSRDFVEM
jgi:putative endonuclease